MRNPIRSVVISIFTIWLTGCMVMPVQAATVDELAAKKKALELRAAQADAAAKQQKSVAETAAEQLSEVENEIDYLDNTLSQTVESISTTQAQVGEKNQDIAKLESDLRAISDQQNGLVRRLYMMSMSYNSDLTFFANEDVSERERREEQFKALKRSVSLIYSRTVAAKQAVEQTRTQLTEKQAQLESLKIQQQAQQEGLVDAKYYQMQLKQNAEAAITQYSAQAKSARADLASVEQQISAALTAAINANKNGTIASGAGYNVSKGEIVGHMGSTGYSTGPHVHFEVRVDGTAVNPSPYVSNGTFSWPVGDFVITQGFGYTDYASSGAYGGSIHTGIDLAGPYGQPVYAPASGKVILNQYYGGYGYAVAIQIPSGAVVLLGHMTGR